MTFSKKEKFISAYMFIIYVVGIVGIALPLHQDFVRLTPLNFVVSLLLVFYNQVKWQKILVFALIYVYLLGFFAEMLGINGGWLFGDFYHYGAAMGWQIGKTPLTAGLLWVIVTIGTAALINIFWVEKNIFWRSFLGAMLLVLLDLMIEPVAQKLNFWQWQNNHIPLQNYAGWFLIGFLALSGFNYLVPKFKNNMAIVLLFMQFLFFGIFNIL
jgi:bisanhydrobacterioruberin hydratase